MIFGKYGKMILANMERNYPYRKQELELTGELKIKIFEREKYILELKKQVEFRIYRCNFTYFATHLRNEVHRRWYETCCFAKINGTY